MKKAIIISFLLSVFGSISAQKSDKYTPLGAQYATDTMRYVNRNCNSFEYQYKGRSVAEFLRELEVPAGFLTLIPNYYNSNYGNEFRFSSRDSNTTSYIIHDENSLEAESTTYISGSTYNIIRNGNNSLYIIYVRFTPEIKFPTTGFIRENLGKPITPEQYKEFEQYTIVDMKESTVRGK